ncbi:MULTISPECIES: MSMEG_1061 family FMN-dependent PPOX-type flavoprotein [Streptomyces]|uniref:Pyridoxamine 5'-phosphate oxidase family protein n=1 Tax=Streptomyces liliiviolaceus TaxID=2823109 RepID=A0A940Y6B3_9ACTN|nr:MSMEG_1061 family FMN-dependent PPOX-type flavoprotein [Streptomyces liliiviolaceus]MBQ0853942.1 pyridoxamine 5'-phosphate oxidase family protein [Streptomyces liliiviolaceus]
MPHTIDTAGTGPDAVTEEGREGREGREGWVELGSGAELRELLGEPWPIVIEKVHDRLADQDRDIIARSPFCLLATSDSRGNCDVSPRGDAPGFTHVIDSGTLALPDRPGNRRGDSFHNILDNPHAGLLYLIPGSKEVLRVNGRARILSDAPFFDAMTVKGQRPALALVLEIDEIYLHCPASLRRSGVWSPESWQTG